MTRPASASDCESAMKAILLPPAFRSFLKSESPSPTIIQDLLRSEHSVATFDECLEDLADTADAVKAAKVRTVDVFILCGLVCNDAGASVFICPGQFP